MARVSSPSEEITVSVSLEGTQQLLSVEREGRPIVEPSPVGLKAPLDAVGTEPPAVTDVSRTDRTVEETFETTYGKRCSHRHRATEATFTCTFEEGTEAKLDVRVADDGVAYRRRIPETGSVLLADDQGGFEFPSQTTSWLTPYRGNHEGTMRQIPLQKASAEYCTPGLFEVREGDWALVGEAGVDGRYHASRLTSTARSDLIEYAHPGEQAGDKPVRAKGSFETPWRVLIVGDLGDVVESDLVPALVEGPRLEDTDWIEPGRVAWSWWSDSMSPYDFQRQKEFVDYASERGWEYVLVDEGWSPEWVPKLVDYASERDVGIFIWAHWTDLNVADERREKLDRWAEWGIDGIKVDFMDSDEQGRLQFYDALLADAAERRLLVNFHGSIVPVGLRRRWPHVMTYEGVEGAEHLKWSSVTPEHNVALPYTRNVVGPMDYTPVTFSADSRHTSAGHELALSVVYESGLQHFADSIDEYAARPHAEWFLERVPAAWEETRFLRGRPGSEFTVARRRNGAWFVGSIAAGADRTIEVPFPFLDGEREAELIRDGADDALYRETVTVGPSSPLTVTVPQNGGFVLYVE